MSKPWELEWHEFIMPDGLKAQYAIDGNDIKMMIDDDQLPNGTTPRERLDQCYAFYFNFLFKR